MKAIKAIEETGKAEEIRDMDRTEEIKGMASILIPCYNHERFVGDCLGSILDQTYPRFEVIICDDCSKDGSVAAIKEYRERFEEKGIRFLLMESKKNQGITRNLNRMLREASGEFIKIIASDDMLEKTYLSEMVAEMQRDPLLKMLFSNGYKVGEEASYPVGEECILGPLMDGAPDCRERIFQRIYCHNFVPAPTLMLRHSVLREVGGYDEAIGIEDLEMLLRILRRYPRGLGCCEKKIVYYRVNNSSLSSMANTEGVVRRVTFMYGNSVAIARKYREQIPKETYRRRMRELRREYLLKRLIIFVKGLIIFAKGRKR